MKFEISFPTENEELKAETFRLKEEIEELKEDNTRVNQQAKNWENRWTLLTRKGEGFHWRDAG